MSYQPADFAALKVLEVEIGQPLEPISAVNPATGETHRRAQVLVRLHTQPIGALELPLNHPIMQPDVVAACIWAALHREIAAYLQENNLPPIDKLTADGIQTEPPAWLAERQAILANAPLVSVIIPTRERPDMLAKTLDTVLAQDYPNYEVIVVDNVPKTDATADVVRARMRTDSRLHYMREDTPGISSARNRGLTAARGEIVACTDDDVRVDTHWLTELVHGFSVTDRVACVTGMTIAAELESPAQVLFEKGVGFNKGYAPHIYDLTEHRPNNALYPYAAGAFGSGVNMAFRKDVLAAVGNFDPALGAGTPTRGGEDLAVYFRVIMKGHRLVYKPQALVYHYHRREYEALVNQMYGYGVGFTAYLAEVLLFNPLRWFTFAARLPLGLLRAVTMRNKKMEKANDSADATHVDYPPELGKRERRGWIAGPWAFLRSWWRFDRPHLLHHEENKPPTAPASSQNDESGIKSAT